MPIVKTPWLIAGSILGYILVMCSNPVRVSLRDGVRALRRYPSLWLTLGLFGFGYALFQVALRFYLFCVLPPGQAPLFIWSRAVYRPEWSWWSGLHDSLWFLPAFSGREAARQSLLPMLDGTAGLFDNLVSTFPFSAIAALAFLLNWNSRQRVLFHALRKRLGAWGGAAHAFILICALAALVKPALLGAFRFAADSAWIPWTQVIVWLAFLFEYLFGVYIQVYLILLAHCWVRGINFEQQHLIDFAIRRTSYVLRWAVVVMLLSTLLIDVPLILDRFGLIASWLGHESWDSTQWLEISRMALDGLLILFCTVQITLIFHSESLREALLDHGRLLLRNAWPLVWMLVITALHFYLLHMLDYLCLAGFGEGTALWLSWKLLFPWFAGAVGAWLLVSWVGVFERCDTGRAQSEHWVQF